MKILLSEKKLEKEIRDCINQNMFKYFGIYGDLSLIKIDRDYWSIILIYQIKAKKNNYDTHYIYCKIPKSDWRVTTVDGILKYNYENSKKMAEIELNSLQYLYKIFSECPDPSLNVIKPLDFISKYNAILTLGVNDSFEIFKLLRKVGRKKNITKYAKLLCEKMGLWLGYIHKVGFKDFKQFPSYPTFNEQIQKYKTMVRELFNINDKVKNKLLKYLEKLEFLVLDINFKVERTFVIEGFEVRNFIANKENIYFLDPGKIFISDIYEDLSRFIVSLSILYWGRPDFVFPFKNETYFIQLFINAYKKYNHIELNSSILSIYIAKQYIKLWIDGLKVLIFKKYPKIVSDLIQKIYIERFFLKRIDTTLKMLKREMINV